ncbi:hypothetical protein HELRODRAFT_174092 [Helobdella robusta]|uniref:Uncharacterized protein n=1 Tax=Helobdella robusta TaxID=6412 RepID=T1F7L3_HELRO|nr:hypothetical protein HELRODRAFT_174092 [Helobdella robusta]ESO03192.1 hypothetical protein HELRODRAFT_174092 [Helobdella robusta]
MAQHMTYQFERTLLFHSGSILAFSNDGSIQSDTTWKCSPSAPTLDSNNNSWYDVDYDDASWLSAVDQYPGSPYMGVMRIWLKDEEDMYCLWNIFAVEPGHCGISARHFTTTPSPRCSLKFNLMHYEVNSNYIFYVK